MKSVTSQKNHAEQVLSCGAVCYVLLGGSNFGVWIKSSSVITQMGAHERNFPLMLWHF